MSMIRYITNYFLRTESYSSMRFVFEMYLIAILTKVVVILLSITAIVVFEPLETLFFGELDDEITQFAGLSWIESLLIYIMIQPFLESIIGQGIPIWLLSKITSSRLIYVICSSIWFTFLHLSVSKVITFILVIFFAGVIFAWCFTVYKEEGFWKGILIATYVHVLYNFTFFISYYVVP